MRFGFHPDDTTPIPRPSRYYGRRQYAPLTDQLRNKPSRQKCRWLRHLCPARPTCLQGRSTRANSPLPNRSAARQGPPEVRGVTTMSGLRATTSDPHHLRFAQPRAIGLKVSDEFTVPLCRGHHRQLHQAGNEEAWWTERNINALTLARDLWGQTRPKSAPGESVSSVDKTNPILPMAPQ